jgi:hypothetical protein
VKACEVAEERGRPGARTAGGVRGDREHDGGEARRPQAGQVGLTEVPGTERPGAVGPREVVAQDAGPDERLDVKVDDVAGAIEIERRLGQRNR